MRKNVEHLSIRSKFDPAETMDRLERAALDRGMTIFCRVNFAADADKVGMDLEATELLIFGNPKVGTLLLQSDQRIGLDLPLKALVRGSAKGETVVDVQDPIDLAAHYRVTDLEVVAKMQQVVYRIAQEATGEAL
ncbi:MULTISPECIES: DUF302 domain-containing protein [unclassified Rhizobium]|uniref:DUF302 domain-containing protein n=1 Tax=unclassified Rhizobium TaxID=2613769 RepID=UPI001ADD05E0|nr:MULTISPECIES: DUF302 domain-containing protein [unclassified Rhizobium]MBO9127793.1 DUF302 domain-containing protein [Rhizobium sp. 16-488-2b]MBO9178255.1 DUF302 domain-containing protein [Rhizobium sp. 16-488-2a]